MGNVERWTRTGTWWRRVVLGALMAGVAASGGASHGGLFLVARLHDAMAEHVEQAELHALVLAGDGEAAFAEAFELGDELFETTFNALDGVGANVGDGQRFTRVPRADLDGWGEWARHVPKRVTGPNAQACNECHNLPADDGGGTAAVNVVRDPLHTETLRRFISRNTTHLFAPGALQRLAEEMTADLHAIREGAVERCRRRRESVSRRLLSKGVDFGRIVVRLRYSRCEVQTHRVEGVSGDLVVRPFQWKGVEPTVRSFNRGASHNELGMQPVELTGFGVDGDGDGVVDEMTIGDQTALAIYIAAQPRPVSTLELSALGLIPPLSGDEVLAIGRGEEVFAAIGCDSCHAPELRIDDPVFSEPSLHASHRDEVFPSGIDPIAELVDPTVPVSFDLTRDQPDNRIELPNGDIVLLGAFERDGEGRGIVRLYGDLKRHYMGERLAEGIDDEGVPAAVWMTTELWGVGSTAPYLHDGRATTLTEAILLHGGEAYGEREAFESLPESDQKALIRFLESLVLFKHEEEE